MFIVGRAVAGMGASGIQNGGFTIIAQSVPMRKRPPLTGLVLGLSQLGLVMGPLIGGALTEYTSWRWCEYSTYIHLPKFLLQHRLLHQLASRWRCRHFAPLRPPPRNFERPNLAYRLSRSRPHRLRTLCTSYDPTASRIAIWREPVFLE